MALIAIAVYDTDENKRSSITEKCLIQLRRTITPSDKVGVYNNGSCVESSGNMDRLKQDGIVDYLYHGVENIGTAKAVNHIWKRHMTPDGIKVKMDNDCFIHCHGWLEEAKEVFKRCPDIGIIGLKRIDVSEHPEAESLQYRSVLSFAMPNSPGYWIAVEEVHHVIGTCHVYRPELLENIGYLYQMNGLYGFDDFLMCRRSQLAGFRTVFLPHIRIDHLDEITGYVQWKRAYAMDMMREFNKTAKGYQDGSIPIYYGGE
ncbi:MAG: hypothetical protein ABIL06_13215 [Pseudomonadota bacterium]|uniref:Putative glycosyltransferase n=1 Tax=viral metagenome TaxID=1070528 RepID=A0A6M3XAK0_9ZZZZ